MPFQLTDIHTTADIGMTATGKDLKELFTDSAVGLSEIMVDVKGLDESRRLPLEIKADSLGELYYDWLSEIIYYKDAELFLFKRAAIEMLDETRMIIKATLIGDTIDPDRHVLKIDVKAVTHYKFRIEKINNQWCGEVVFDL